MDAVDVDIFVLNYNGRALLGECLPSVLAAAANSRHDCRVTVVDNASTDDSSAFIAREFPSVGVVRMPNLGLTSLNEAVRASSARVVLLLNNDIKLAESAVDPLVEPLLATADDDEPVFLTTPRCCLFDGVTHEGFRTAVRLRFGLVQATAHFPGASETAACAGETASAGAAIAVDRNVFLRLGGFDPLYLPGRIEDLDFCFRGFLAGYRAAYVPQSPAFHRGAASFGPEFGDEGNRRLALRNTILFQWKNLRLARHRLRMVAAWPIRVVRDLAFAPFLPAGRRFPFIRAWREARELWNKRPHDDAYAPASGPAATKRESQFFTRFAFPRLTRGAVASSDDVAAWKVDEARRAERYPIARWYLRPVAEAMALRLAGTSVRPWHLTAIGMVTASAAVAKLLVDGYTSLAAAALVLAAYFFDRVDGPLARLRRDATPWGAWLDANVDEAVDLGLHVCTAVVAARQVGGDGSWYLLIAFLFGKYLLMHGLATPAEAAAESVASAGTRRSISWPRLRRWYHLPANSDVRMHLLIGAIAFGVPAVELAVVAAYYNFRWPLRYILVARRMGHAVPARGAA